MRPPRFLSVEDAVAIHADTLAHEGGLAGLRNHALLESAVMIPQQQFGGQFLHGGLHAMAAAYLFHVTRNHPFVDGNKRAGAMAAFVFLDVNGTDLTATPKELERTVLAIADGSLSKDELTARMRKHTKRRSPRRSVLP